MFNKISSLKFIQRQIVVLILALAYSAIAFSQVSTHVTGKVTNEKGEAISGGSVTIVGNTKGSLTDQNGIYSIDVNANGSLLFSSLGMESQTIAVSNRTLIDVTLKSKEEALGEVTVVAFGTQKKESVVGSITTIRPSELKIPSSNLTTALAGRLAGVIAYQRSGEPGADNANFFIRGVTSFGFSNNPLILVDGVEMTIRDLSNLQVDNIASFSILKDATATSLYGSRAANGVILISTKEGKEGKASVSVRYETAISSPTQNIKLADPVTYMKLQNESITTRD
ncbi:MAG: TonB-dependent receptor plug domain-containing protein, partial [Ginsengibacter sp.]